MKTPINNDNVYRTGTTIYARVNPDIRLFIREYKARIYYCNVVGAEGGAVLTYFERELIPDVQRLRNPAGLS